jgi:hypothetical protein
VLSIFSFREKEKVMSAIQEITKFAEDIKAGNGPVQPGAPMRFPDAVSVNDAIAQGDLLLKVVNSVPAGFTKVDKLEPKDMQLVVGNTVGAKHALSHLNGVTLYRPAEWTVESFIGPIFVCNQEVAVTHPVHGNVTVPANTMIACEYQKELDLIEAIERRARD